MRKKQRLEVRGQRLDIDIDHVAELASLSLTAAQKEKFSKQLKEVLSYFRKLNEIRTDKVEPIGQITGLENITRGDETAPSLTQEAALKNAPRKHNGFFEVDAIFPE